MKNWFNKISLPVVPRMYVIVRKELSDSYRMVQGAHALAQYSFEHNENFRKWDNRYLIFLATFLPVNLYNLRYKLIRKMIPTSGFFEPDLKDEMTAFCVFYNPKNIEEAKTIIEIIGELPLA